MKLKQAVVTASAGLLIVLAGCQSAPQAVIDAAKAAVKTAESAEASRYAAAQFNAMQDSLDAAMAEIDVQNGKFALIRNYGRAQQLLHSVISMADSTEQAALANKDAVHLEAEQLISQMQTQVVEARKLATKAPTGKEGRAALKMIESEIGTIEVTLAEASTAFNAGDYLNARDKAKAGMEKLQSITKELQTAIAKAGHRS